MPETTSPAQSPTAAAVGQTNTTPKSKVEVKKDPIVKFADSVDASVVSEKSLKIIKDNMNTASVTELMITSTSRTVQKQAEVMYNNCEATGVDTQLAIYGDSGKKVINKYKELKDAKKTKDEIISGMTSEIEDVKKTNTTAFQHTGDHTKKNVFDIGQSSITPQNNKADLEKNLKADTKINLMLNENSCFHVEIAQ